MTKPQLNSDIGTTSPDGRVLMSRRLYDLLLERGRNPDAMPTPLTIGPSPFTYTNASGFDQDVLLNGGTVSLVQIGRGGSLYTTTSPVRLSPGDSVRITYTVAPAATIMPR